MTNLVGRRAPVAEGGARRLVGPRLTFVVCVALLLGCEGEADGQRATQGSALSTQPSSSGGGEADIVQHAEWICRYGVFSEEAAVAYAAGDEEVDLQAHLTDEAMELVGVGVQNAERRAAASGQSPNPVAVESVRLLRRAYAAKTNCDVQVEIQGSSATARVTRNLPGYSDGCNAVGLILQLPQAANTSERQQRIDVCLVEGADNGEQTSATLRFRRTEAGWRADLPTGEQPLDQRRRASCPDGGARNYDNQFHCCFRAQAWSSERGQCVGTPYCLNNSVAVGDRCECEGGRTRSADTQGQCCWGGQAWASGTGCVGAPTRCPEGRRVLGDGCVRSPEEIAVSLGTAFEALDDGWAYSDVRIEDCVLRYVRQHQRPYRYVESQGGPEQETPVVYFRQDISVELRGIQGIRAAASRFPYTFVVRVAGTDDTLVSVSSTAVPLLERFVRASDNGVSSRDGIGWTLYSRAEGEALEGAIREAAYLCKPR